MALTSMSITWRAAPAQAVLVGTLTTPSARRLSPCRFFPEGKCSYFKGLACRCVAPCYTFSEPDLNWTDNTINRFERMLYKRLFGDQTPSTIKRPVLGAQLELMRDWVSPLSAAPQPELTALGPLLTAASSRSSTTSKSCPAKTSATPRPRPCAPSSPRPLSAAPTSRPARRLCRPSSPSSLVPAPPRPVRLPPELPAGSVTKERQAARSPRTSPKTWPLARV